MNNYCFIDSQNLYQGVKGHGWQLDYRRFRGWLKNRYHITRAFMFFGYVKDNEGLYRHLTRCGFELVFRDIEEDAGYMKGNVDIDMTLAVIDRQAEHDLTYLVTSDGDFYTLVKRLREQGKLGGVISPHQDTCSRFLKVASEGRIAYLEAVRHKLCRQ